MDDLKKALDTALARIAALESRGAQPTLDPAAMRRAIVSDPIGFLQRMQLSPEELVHVSRVHVAHTLGDQAPEPLRMLAQMGPQMTATQSLADGLQSLRQKIEQIDARESAKTLRTSFSAVSNDKTKYPLLAAAIARNPSLFDSDIDSHKGDAAALAQALETRLAETSKALGVTPPASQEKAANAQDQSSQIKAQQEVVAGHGNAGITPPPIPQNKVSGTWNQETAAELKERIIRKYEQPQQR